MNLPLMKLKSYILLLAVSLLYACAIFYFSPYTRGSDQFWYVGDVERLVQGDGLNKTNNIFPASAPNDSLQQPRTWVQNRPVLYVAAVADYLIENSHFSWLFINCMCLFIAGFLFANLVSKKTSTFLVAYVSFLLFPMNFYLCMQPLADLFNLLMATLIIYTFLNFKHSIRSIICISLFTGILICERDNYVLLLFVFPFLWWKGKESIFQIGYFIIIVSVIVVVKKNVFPSNLLNGLSFADAIFHMPANQSNMSHYLYTEFPTLSLAGKILIVWEKIIAALKHQFLSVGSGFVFFYSLNILFIGYLFLFAKSFREKRVQLITAFVVVHLITIVAFQNQYRYAATMIPSLFLANVWLLKSLKKLNQKLILNSVIGILVGCFLVCLFSGKMNRTEAFKMQKATNEIKKIHHDLNIENLLIEFDTGACLNQAYAVSPSLVFYFPENYPNEKLINKCHSFHTKWLIVNKTAAIYNFLKPHIVSEQELKETKNKVLVSTSF